MPERYEPVFYVRLQPVGAPRNVWHRLDLTGRVTAFTYEDDERAADKLELTLDNFDLLHFDDPAWRTGAKLVTSWGYPGIMAPARTVIIRKVTGFQQLRIQADGLEVIAQREPHHRVWENKKRSEVVRELAQALGYRSDDVLHVRDTEEVEEQIVQANLTDAQFLRRLAEQEGFLWFIDWDGFHFHPEDLLQARLRTFRYYNIEPQAEGDVISFEVEGDITAKPGRTKTRGRSPKEKEDIEGAETQETYKGAITSVVEIVTDPETGAREEFGYSVLVPQVSVEPIGRAPPGGSGDVPVYYPDPSLEPGQPASFLPEALPEPTGPQLPSSFLEPGYLPDPQLPSPVTSQDEKDNPAATARNVPTTAETKAGAEKDAKKQYRGVKRQALKVNVKVVGAPTIVAKTLFELENAGKKLSQRYYIRRAKHTLGSGGFVVDLEATADGAGGSRRASQIAPGLSSIGVRAARTRRPKKKREPDPTVPPAPLQPQVAEDPRFPGQLRIVHGKQVRQRPHATNPHGSYTDPTAHEVTPTELVEPLLPPGAGGAPGAGGPPGESGSETWTDEYPMLPPPPPPPGAGIPIEGEEPAAPSPPSP